MRGLTNRSAPKKTSGPEEPQRMGRPIRIVVGPFRDGPFDAMSRQFARHLGQRLGRPVLIDDSRDVGGSLGLAAVARAAPNGGTLLWTRSSTAAITPCLYGERPFKPSRDFMPVALFFAVPGGLIVDRRVAPGLQPHLEWLRQVAESPDGLYAPPGTPLTVIERLANASLEAWRTDDMRSRLARAGIDLVVLSGRAACMYLGMEAA